MKTEGNEIRMKIEDNMVHYNIVNKNGYDYYLAIEPTLWHVRFGKERTETKTTRLHSISEIGGNYLLTHDGKIEKKVHIPVEFVHAKYHQTKNFFEGIKPVQDKLCEGRLDAEDPELASQIDLHAIRIVNGLLDDLANDQNIAEEIDNKLNLGIRNVSDNGSVGENGWPLDLIKSHINLKDDDWMIFKFAGYSYYHLEPTALQDNDTLYYLAVSKNYNHMVFAKGQLAESKNIIYELYISQDDGLGRYKVQAGDNVITQFFVPTEFISLHM